MGFSSITLNSIVFSSVSFLSIAGSPGRGRPARAGGIERAKKGELEGGGAGCLELRPVQGHLHSLKSFFRTWTGQISSTQGCCECICF